jgi:hypothetical protein
MPSALVLFQELVQLCGLRQILADELGLQAVLLLA